MLVVSHITLVHINNLLDLKLAHCLLRSIKLLLHFQMSAFQKVRHLLEQFYHQLEDLQSFYSFTPKSLITLQLQRLPCDFELSLTPHNYRQLRQVRQIKQDPQKSIPS